MTEIEASDSLRSFYGVRLPSEAARLVAWWNGDEQRRMQFGLRFGLDICVARQVVRSTETSVAHLPMTASDPPELVAMFGAFTRYGYLCLAPELDLELPFVCSDPNSYQMPVYVYSNGLREALEYQLVDDTISEPNLREVFSYPLESRGMPTHKAADFRDSLVIPPGYSYKRGIDMTGVLAPSEAFRREAPIVNEGDDFDDHLAHVEKLIRDGYPASAILLLRDIRTVLWLTDDIRGTMYKSVLQYWSAAARGLGREGHARIVDQMIAQHLEAQRR